MQTENAANRIKELTAGKEDIVGLRIGVRRSKEARLRVSLKCLFLFASLQEDAAAILTI